MLVTLEKQWKVGHIWNVGYEVRLPRLYTPQSIDCGTDWCHVTSSLGLAKCTVIAQSKQSYCLCFEEQLNSSGGTRECRSFQRANVECCQALLQASSALPQQELAVATRKRPHRSTLVQEELARQQVVVLLQPPYSPDLSLCDFFLFLRLKEKLRGRTLSRSRRSYGRGILIVQR